MKSSSAKCLVLDRESFDLLLGPLKARPEEPSLRFASLPWVFPSEDIIDAVREGRERPQHTAANPAENGRPSASRALDTGCTQNAHGCTVFLLLRVPGPESTADPTERAEAHRLAGLRRLRGRGALGAHQDRLTGEGTW